MQPLVRDQLVKNGHGAGGSRTPQELASREPPPAKLAHSPLLKHILGVSKSRASFIIVRGWKLTRKRLGAGHNPGGRERRADADRADDVAARGRSPRYRDGPRRRAHRALLDPALRPDPVRLGRPHARAPGGAVGVPRDVLDGLDAPLGARAQDRARWRAVPGLRPGELRPRRSPPVGAGRCSEPSSGTGTGACGPNSVSSTGSRISSVIATSDYDLVTGSVGLIDRSSRARVLLGGADAVDFLQGQVTNDVAALAPGGGCYAAILNHKGKLRTDLRILRGEDWVGWTPRTSAVPCCSTWSRPTASAARSPWTRWPPGARSCRWWAGRGRRAGGGPARGRALLRRGAPRLYVRTHLGVDVFCDDPAAVRESLDVEEVSEEAAECARIESGRPRLGYDMDGDTIPQEADLNDRAVSFTKGCYVGQETVARLYYKGKPNRHLRGLRLGGPRRAARRFSSGSAWWAGSARYANRRGWDRSRWRWCDVRPRRATRYSWRGHRPPWSRCPSTLADRRAAPPEPPGPARQQRAAGRTAERGGRGRGAAPAGRELRRAKRRPRPASRARTAPAHAPRELRELIPPPDTGRQVDDWGRSERALH